MHIEFHVCSGQNADQELGGDVLGCVGLHLGERRMEWTYSGISGFVPCHGHFGGLDAVNLRFLVTCEGGRGRVEDYSIVGEGTDRKW